MQSSRFCTGNIDIHQSPYSALSSPTSFRFVRIRRTVIVSTCCSPSCSSIVSSVRSSGTVTRRKNAKSVVNESSPVNFCFLLRKGNKVEGNEFWRKIRSLFLSCRVIQREVEIIEEIDLEAEVYDFMVKSGNPGRFPSKEDLITAGRMDLVEAIASHGGWLAYGWDFDEADDGDNSTDQFNEEEFVNEEEDHENERFDGRSIDDGFFSINLFDTKSATKEVSFDERFDGRTINDDEGGIDGILMRLEKERFLSFTDINHMTLSEVYHSHHSASGKAHSRRNFSPDHQMQVFQKFEGRTTNGAKNIQNGFHQKEQDSSFKDGQNDIQSRLLLLESELFSILSSIRSQKALVSSLEGKERSQDKAHMLADAHEFVETEIMNVQDKLRSTKSQKFVLEGKMALQLIELQKIIDEKQRRIDAAQKALNYFRTAYVTWPNSGLEVLLAGSFDGWTTQRRMERSSTGVFFLNLKLYPGQYEIKFIVDGVWKIDPLRPIVNNHGFENNLLTVI